MSRTKTDFCCYTKDWIMGNYRWPRTEYEAKQLTSQQLRWLMEGLEIEQKKAIKPGKRKCLY